MSSPIEFRPPLSASQSSPIAQTLTSASQSKIDEIWLKRTHLDPAEVNSVAMQILAHLPVVRNNSDSDSLQKIEDICSAILGTRNKKIDEKELALLEREKIAAAYYHAIQKGETPENLSASQFHIKHNQKLFAKWLKAGIDPLAFVLNPSASELLLDGHIHISANYWGHDIEIDKETHELRIMIEGEMKPFEPLAQTLAKSETPLFNQIKDTRLIEKDDSEKTWCYLPTKGLSRWQETSWKKLKPCGSVTNETLERARRLAKIESSNFKEKQPQDQDTYVIELVTSWIDYPSNAFTGGVHRTFGAPRHPWIRIMTPDGKFYSVGFNLGGKLPLPASFTKGTFRTPDCWETMPNLYRLVTGVKATQEDVNKLINFIELRQDDSQDFNMIERNCTEFIQQAIGLLGIDKKANGKPIRFHATLTEVIKRVQPLFIQRVYKKTKTIRRMMSDFIKEIAPPFLYKLARITTNLSRAIGSRIALLFAGRKLSFFNKKSKQLTEALNKEGKYTKTLPSWHIFSRVEKATDEMLVKAFLPIRVIEWQMKLQGPDETPATRVYANSQPISEQYSPEYTEAAYTELKDKIENM